MRIMFSKKWLVNLLLAGLAAFIGLKAYDAWSQKAAIPPDETAEAKLPAAPPANVAARDAVPAAAYDLVVEKNLFAAEREEIFPTQPETKPDKKAKEKPEEKQKLSRRELRALNKLSLIGVVLIGDRKTALITGITGKGRGVSTQWIVEGDEVQGMRVGEISDEKIVLTSNDTEMEILLYDPEKPRKRSAPKKEAQPTVISTGGNKAGATPKAPETKAKTAPQETIRKLPEKIPQNRLDTLPTSIKRSLLREKNPS